MLRVKFILVYRKFIGDKARKRHEPVREFFLVFARFRRYRNVVGRHGKLPATVNFLALIIVVGNGFDIIIRLDCRRNSNRFSLLCGRGSRKGHPRSGLRNGNCISRFLAAFVVIAVAAVGATPCKRSRERYCYARTKNTFKNFHHI